jgi:hypothetical protein
MSDEDEISEVYASPGKSRRISSNNTMKKETVTLPVSNLRAFQFDSGMFVSKIHPIYYRLSLLCILFAI